MPGKSKEGGSPPPAATGAAVFRSPLSGDTPEPRLAFREFRPEDRNDLLSFVREPGQLKYMLFDLSTEAAVDEFLAFAQAQKDAVPRREWHWAVEEAGRPGVIGSVALMVEADSPSSAEVGYWFRQEFWGRGYAVEAGRFALTQGFEVLGLHRLWGKCHEDNRASSRVMEKLGMVREGRHREHVWLRDHHRTSLVYALLDRDYRSPPSGPVDFRGRPFRFVDQRRGAQQLAVLYPGMGYSLKAPLFFYLSAALEQSGWDVLGIDTRYNDDPEFQTASDGERDRWFEADSLALGRWVASLTPEYQRVAYLGKSLGTTMLLHQVQAGLVRPEAPLVWLTPGSTAAEQFDLLPRLPQHSLVVYGTADPHFLKAADRRPVDLPLVTVCEIPDAGHVFEVDGDVRRSITNIANVVEVVLAFLQETSKEKQK